MFRPNRIGTPNIHTANFLTSTANFTPATQNYDGNSYNGNVINATPALDFGHINLLWRASEAIGASLRWALYHQFTVTRPLSGDAVGLELCAGIIFKGPSALTLEPCVTKLVAAGAATLDQVQNSDLPTMIESSPRVFTPVTDNGLIKAYYKTQVIWQSGSIPEGTMAHGFQIYDSGATGYTTTFFKMSASVRQLNDQQAIGYRDTLR